MVKILIVDDHPIVREGLARTLEKWFPGCKPEAAADSVEAMKAVWDHAWDLVLLDISMPGRSGLDLMKEIHSARPKLPVLIMTFHPEEQFSLRALKAGAAGYLPKSAPAEVVQQAIRQVLAGGRFITAKAAELMAANLGMDADRPLHEVLSDREYDIFVRLGRGETVGEIALSLNLSVKTISTYRARIMTKTGLKNNADVAQYAIRNNLVD